MTDTFVVDSSAVVAALCDSGDAGTWSATKIQAGRIAAPELMLYEAANVLRRLEMAADITSTEASLAYADLRVLPVELWPFDALAERIWELRSSVSSYDAAYVALAELLEAPLVTLDQRLSRANGPRCVVMTP